VRVIGADGSQLGVIATEQALSLAREQEMDLVEVGPHRKATRLPSHGFRQIQILAEEKAHSTHSHHTKIKEIRVRPKTGDHDIETKVNQAKGFLAHKDKVIVSVVFRGRELAHIEEGHRVLKRVLQLLDEAGKPESPPSQQGSA